MSDHVMVSAEIIKQSPLGAELDDEQTVVQRHGRMGLHPQRTAAGGVGVEAERHRQRAAGVAAALPRSLVETAMRRARPPVAVVPAAVGGPPMPDVEHEVRAALGVES